MNIPVPSCAVLRVVREGDVLGYLPSVWGVRRCEAMDAVCALTHRHTRTTPTV